MIAQTRTNEWRKKNTITEDVHGTVSGLDFFLSLWSVCVVMRPSVNCAIERKEVNKGNEKEIERTREREREVMLWLE